MEAKPDRPKEEEQPKALETELAQAAESSAPRDVSFDYGYLSPIPPGGNSWDEWIIERGIEAALREGRSVDDRTARYIAAQLHGGQLSALYSLASSGAIDESRVYDELSYGIEQQTEQIRCWSRWLNGYCSLRPDTGPVDDWNQRAAKQDRAEMETLRRERTLAALDALFGGQQGEEIGDVQELGWFGLIRHEGQPGGLILSQDNQGFRHVWETDSDQELSLRWAGLNDDYQDFYRRVEEQEQPGGAASKQQADDTATRADEPAKHHRLAELAERLAPLPDLGDIPRPAWGHSFGSGWEWMEEGLPEGWHVEPSWGRDGWDLGSWPLIAVGLFIDEDRDRYALATYTEGDVTVNRYKSRGALHVAVNEIAEFHWRLGQSRGPSDLPEGKGLLAKHCGPFSETRHDREVAEEVAKHIVGEDE